MEIKMNIFEDHWKEEVSEIRKLLQVWPELCQTWQPTSSCDCQGCAPCARSETEARAGELLAQLR